MLVICCVVVVTFIQCTLIKLAEHRPHSHHPGTVDGGGGRRRAGAAQDVIQYDSGERQITPITMITGVAALFVTTVLHRVPGPHCCFLEHNVGVRILPVAIFYIRQ